FLRCIPNMIIMAPSDENETRQMLYTGYQHQGPAAVRYPRGTGPGAVIEQEMTALPIGKARVLKSGKRVAILAFGNMVTPSLQVAETLGATLVDMRFVKPLDEALILDMAAPPPLIVPVGGNSPLGRARRGGG